MCRKSLRLKLRCINQCSNLAEDIMALLFPDNALGQIDQSDQHILINCTLLYDTMYQ